MWFPGNLLCGGIIGMVADVLTGAMWEPAQLRIFWTFEQKGLTAAGMPIYALRLTMTGNNGKQALAETLIVPGNGARTVHFADLVTEIH